MQSDNQTAPVSKKMLKKMLWTGRIISALPALFLLGKRSAMRREGDQS
jgi:hypothetical protein